MKIINRKMESNAITTDESHLICQASFNSDGVIDNLDVLLLLRSVLAI